MENRRANCFKRRPQCRGGRLEQIPKEARRPKDLCEIARGSRFNPGFPPPKGGISWKCGSLCARMTPWTLADTSPRARGRSRRSGPAPGQGESAGYPRRRGKHGLQVCRYWKGRPQPAAPRSPKKKDRQRDGILIIDPPTTLPNGQLQGDGAGDGESSLPGRVGRRSLLRGRRWFPGCPREAAGKTKRGCPRDSLC